MIFWELLRVFALALVGITGMFLLGGVVQEASQRGLSPSQIGTVIPLLLPTTLPYTVPATLLFATCVVYGRLAHDNEITALRSAGVHLGWLLAPAISFASVISIALLVMECNLIPRSRQMLSDRIIANADELIYALLKRNGCIRHPQMQFAVFVRDVQGQILVDPVFKRRGPGNTYSLVAHAREARLWTDAANGKVWIYMPKCAVAGTDEVDGQLRDQTFPIDFPLSDFRDQRIRPMNMTWQQITDTRADIARQQVERQAELANLQQPVADPAKREHNAQIKKVVAFRYQEAIRDQRHLITELHLRPALALGGVLFVLVAFPVGVWFHRADFLSTFVSCFLPVVMIYYPLLLAGANMSREGGMLAATTVWLADATTLSVGVWMLRRLFRR